MGSSGSDSDYSNDSDAEIAGIRFMWENAVNQKSEVWRYKGLGCILTHTIPWTLVKLFRSMPFLCEIALA
ncbi:hypothetical protein HKD37_20G057693 [Glycine soja]|uniref:Uncharacterized protein n=1 Tax=Glycine soja TaxID=3848 RepID=A0A445EY34_GLYSO|nr:hypothetical protein D0Y65_055367 [Glycine soja]RZB45280.1 hypothetical protein D0Y65_054891 [Glycine soja]